MAAATAGTFTQAAAPQAVCTVQLRVNVFGSGPAANWALQGALNTGKSATLRASATGCSLDHITGRVADRAVAPLTHACGGATCSWTLLSRRMQAITFQAYTRAASGRSVRSNQVRVAWGGHHVNTWSGIWHVDGSGYSGDYNLNQAGTTVTGTCNWLGGCRDTGNLSGDGSTWRGTSTPNDPSLTVSTFTFKMASDGQSFSGNGTTASGTSWSESAACTSGPCTTNE